MYDLLARLLALLLLAFMAQSSTGVTADATRSSSNGHGTSGKSAQVDNHRLKSISDGTPLAARDWIGPGMRPLQRTTRPSSGAAVSQRFFDPTSHVDTGWDAAQRLIRMTYRDAGGQVIADLGYAYGRTLSEISPGLSALVKLEGECAIEIDSRCTLRF